MKIQLILTGLMILGMVAAVSAHGIHIATETDADVVIIADQDSADLARRVVSELGVNAGVFEFTSPGQVNHELGHFIFDHDYTVLAVAYQDTVEEFIVNNPQSSDQIRVSAAEEEEIRNNLMELTENGTGEPTTPPVEESGFLIPFILGLLVGFVAGLGLGAFWMKRKSA